jgi:hypothetical protein
MCVEYADLPIAAVLYYGGLLSTFMLGYFIPRRK